MRDIKTVITFKMSLENFSNLFLFFSHSDSIDIAGVFPFDYSIGNTQTHEHTDNYCNPLCMCGVICLMSLL